MGGAGGVAGASSPLAAAAGQVHGPPLAEALPAVRRAMSMQSAKIEAAGAGAGRQRSPLLAAGAGALGGTSAPPAVTLPASPAASTLAALSLKSASSSSSSSS